MFLLCVQYPFLSLLEEWNGIGGTLMNWLELPWILVPLWALVLFLDFLYVTDTGPRIVIRALRAVFKRYAAHALI